MTKSLQRAPTERRVFGRRNCCKRARIIAAGREHPCLIVNISEGGALLQVTEGECHADAFELTIDEDDIIVDCEVAHRTSGRIGVRYARMPRRLSHLKKRGVEAENAGKIIAALISKSK